MQTVLFIVGVMLAIYLIYISGYMPIHSLRRAAYYGNMREANFSKCSGFMKQIFRVKETKIYKFFLEKHLSDGRVWVEIHDASKNCIAILDTNNDSADIELVKNKRYYITVNFEKATGCYKIYKD